MKNRIGKVLEVLGMISLFGGAVVAVSVNPPDGLGLLWAVCLGVGAALVGLGSYLKDGNPDPRRS